MRSVLARSDTNYGAYRVDLEIHRSAPVWNHMVLGRFVRQVYAVGTLLEQVDCGCAVQGEMRGVDRVLKHRIAVI